MIPDPNAGWTLARISEKQAIQADAAREIAAQLRRTNDLLERLLCAQIAMLNPREHNDYVAMLNAVIEGEQVRDAD